MPVWCQGSGGWGGACSVFRRLESAFHQTCILLFVFIQDLPNPNYTVVGIALNITQVLHNRPVFVLSCDRLHNISLTMVQPNRHGASGSSVSNGRNS